MLALCACPSTPRPPREPWQLPSALFTARVTPRATPLYRRVETHYQEVKAQWKERFEGHYDFSRTSTDKAVGAYLDCGVLENGFARLRCGTCRAEFLVPLSCKGRGLCPSRAAKRAGHEPHPASAPLDSKDFLARVLMHIPDPRRHVIRYYGAYSSVVRARRRHMAPAVAGPPCTPEPPTSGALADPDLRALRRRWAELIRRIYEVDPLVCPRCGGTMRIIAVLTDPRVITKILRHLVAKGADPRSPPQGGAAAA